MDNECMIVVSLTTFPARIGNVHRVIEALPDWIEFFQKGLAAEGLELPKNTRIVHLDYGFETFEGVKNVRVYKRFKSALRNKQFDFISIDGPRRTATSSHAPTNPI